MVYWNNIFANIYCWGGVLCFVKLDAENPLDSLIRGYRTELALQSQQNYNFANKICGICELVLGCILLVLAIALNCLKVKIGIFMSVYMSTLFVGVAITIFLPQVLLKIKIKKENKTGNEGN